jgi:hypothetical protein
MKCREQEIREAEAQLGSCPFALALTRAWTGSKGALHDESLLDWTGLDDAARMIRSPRMICRMP